MTTSQYSALAVLFLLLLATWLLADFAEQKEREIAVASVLSPDYFGLGYAKKEMDATGATKNELKAAKIIHYRNDGTTHFEQPRLILHNATTAPWVIQSQAGVLAADGDQLLLSGQVFISNDGSKQRKPFKLSTSALNIKLSTSHAQTSQWAQIISGSNKTEGIGLQTTFSYPIKVKFLSRVKGRYAVN